MVISIEKELLELKKRVDIHDLQLELITGSFLKEYVSKQPLNGKDGKKNDDYEIIQCPNCKGVLLRRRSQMLDEHPCWFCKVNLNGIDHIYKNGEGK